MANARHPDLEPVGHQQSDGNQRTDKIHAITLIAVGAALVFPLALLVVHFVSGGDGFTNADSKLAGTKSHDQTLGEKQTKQHDFDATAVVNEILAEQSEKNATERAVLPESSTSSSVTQPGGVLSPSEIYKLVAPSVVVIRGIRSDDGQLDSYGSGFFLRRDSVIVTNEHVIRGAKVVEIRTLSEQTARVFTALAVDTDRDIAVLPVPDSLFGTPNLRLASSLPDVGDPVYAIGAPQGLEYTLTQGIVSQIRKVGAEYGTLIQTDVSLSAGSSGGPLVDAQGHVVGINTLASRAVDEAHNLNFAVASPEIKAVMQNRREQALIALDSYKAWVEALRELDKHRQSP